MWSGGDWFEDEFQYYTFRPSITHDDVIIEYTLIEDFGDRLLYDAMYIPFHIIKDKEKWEDYLDNLLKSEE